MILAGLTARGATSFLRSVKGMLGLFPAGSVDGWLSLRVWRLARARQAVDLELWRFADFQEVVMCSSFWLWRVFSQGEHKIRKFLNTIHEIPNSVNH